MANILKAMGVDKGDVVTIYLPRIPEVFFAMLACAKLGAIHSVVFAGYSSDALSARIDDSESKVVITADGSWINGKVFPMKKIVDDAVRFSPTVQNVIVVSNTGTEAVMDPIRDHWYHELCKLPIAQGRCETVQVDLKTYEGIRIDKAALHIVNGQRGVYVKYGNLQRFLKITTLYENDSYILVPEDGKLGSANEVRLYDEIIVQGTNLQDGKLL